jgi:single-stranded-DNA-specific exonuclease
MYWKEKNTNEQLTSLLGKRLKISPLLSHLLVCRGIESPEEAYYFLYGDMDNTFSPFIFTDMKKTVDYAKNLILNKKPIFIVGDKDVDGITGTAILHSFFSRAGLNDIYYDLPMEKESYGFSKRIFNNIISKTGLDTVITVDCGIKENEFIEKLNHHKINTLVTDHHTISEELPKAYSIINPHMENNYAISYLSGAAVALKFVQAMYFSYHSFYDKPILFLTHSHNSFKAVRSLNFVLEHNELDLSADDLKDFVRLNPTGIIISENNSIAKIQETLCSLKQVIEISSFCQKNIFKTPREESLEKICTQLNIYYNPSKIHKTLFSMMKKIIFKYYLHLEDQLIKVIQYATLGTICDSVPMNAVENHILVKCGLGHINKNKPIFIQKLIKDENAAIDTRSVGFEIGPILNSGGRLGESATSFQFLIMEEKEQIEKLHERLITLNDKRKKIGDQAYKDALQEIELYQKENEVLMYSSASLIKGVTGNVATKIARNYRKPSFVFSIDEDVQEIVGSGRCFLDIDLLSMIGDTKKIFTRFGGHKKACGMSFSSTHLSEVTQMILFHTKKYFDSEKIDDFLYYDIEIPVETINFMVLGELEQLYPFGTDNEKPLFFSRNLHPTNHKLMGKNGKHLRFKVKENPNLDFIGWDMAALENLVQHSTVDAIYSVEKNLYQNRVFLQAVLLDLRESK